MLSKRLDSFITNFLIDLRSFLSCETETADYQVLLKPMLSGTTVAGPTGNNSAWSILSLIKAIFSLHTFLKRSLKKPMVRNSPAQRRYPKPNGAYPACRTLDRSDRQHARTLRQSTVGYRSLPAVLDLKGFPAEGALGQPNLLAPGFIVLFTRRSLLIAIRVEVIGLFQ